MKKRVFVGHPISGDVKGNTQKVIQICERMHRFYGVIPVAPYLISLLYLDDSIIQDRLLGIEANHACFESGFVDELWLYGDRISPGMKEEMRAAVCGGIPIIPRTPQATATFGRVLEEIKEDMKLRAAL
jgi:hypothetical protein